MKRTVKYNEVSKRKVDLHAQVSVSEVKDRMSSKANVRISIPPFGGDLGGVLDQVHNGFGCDERQRLDSFDKLGAHIEALREHEVETDPDHPFSDQSFRNEASSYLHEIEAVLDGLSLSEDVCLQVRDAVVTRAFRAGMLASELAARQEHLARVSTEGYRFERLQAQNKSKKGTMTPTNKAGLTRMDELMLEHPELDVTSAASSAAAEGFGSSAEANRSAFRRRQKRLT